MGFSDPRVWVATLSAATLVAQQGVVEGAAGHALPRLVRRRGSDAMIGSRRLLWRARARALACSRRALAEARRARRAPALGGALPSRRAVLGASLRAAAVVTYLHAGALSAAAVSIFWSVVSEAFDPYSARRPSRASWPARRSAASSAGLSRGARRRGSSRGTSCRWERRSTWSASRPCRGCAAARRAHTPRRTSRGGP